MKTKSVLLVSSDKDLIGIIKISALTLTKLNCQVNIEDTADHQQAYQHSKVLNLDLIIIDLDEKSYDPIQLIKKIRKDPESKSKKIISVYSDKTNKDEVYKAGCDSIMSKEELKKVVNNILQF